MMNFLVYSVYICNFHFFISLIRDFPLKEWHRTSISAGGSPWRAASSAVLPASASGKNEVCRTMPDPFKSCLQEKWRQLLHFRMDGHNGLTFSSPSQPQILMRRLKNPQDRLARPIRLSRTSKFHFRNPERFSVFGWSKIPRS